jgi:transcription elongation factor GreA
MSRDQITREGYEALKAELAELEGPARREIAERIKTAREWGDLKENSEYHDAKNDQAFLETKIARLTARLRNAEVVDAADPSGAASVGTTVELRDQESDKTVSYQIVGVTEADLAQGRLSVESPLAQAIIGRRKGDDVVVTAPRGDRRFTVVAVKASR